MERIHLHLKGKEDRTESRQEVININGLKVAGKISKAAKGVGEG